VIHNYYINNATGENQMNAQKYKAWTYFQNGRPTWLTDLPGCDGKKSNGTSSDYGYGDKEHAIEINEYQWKKFAKYQADVGRCGYCSPV